MREDILRVMVSEDGVELTEEAIRRRVHELAAQIERDYAGEEVLMVCILRGSALFFGDLMKYIDLPLVMDFMAASSYGKGTTAGELKIKKDLTEPVAGRHVVLVEDIVDSGQTLTYLKRLMLERGAKSVKIASLLDKPSGRRPGFEMDPEYKGFTVGDEFVVGYGLDYAEKYRNLPFVGVLKPEIYQKH
ncbi:MAG: hypoxanthine phosphoribosyltransferase [Clostridia bacterium]|nr:hypoxanthine phosphoribosyltransferase [Clostridia bacterium]